MPSTAPMPRGGFIFRRGGRGGEQPPKNDRGRGSTTRGIQTSWRGRGASEGRTPQRGYFQSNHRQAKVEPLEAQAKGELLDEIELNDGKWSSRYGGKASTIRDSEYVTSYNLLHRKITTILVPGAPRAWTPPAECPELWHDHGHFFKDAVEARWPTFPLEPGIRAVFEIRPEFDGSELKLVTCATVLENLLRFLTATERSFRFNVELIGETVFFVSKGTSPKEGIPEVKGYGHTYPEAYTSWSPAMKDSVCHQRLVKYRFGNLECLVQFKADGYAKESAKDGDDSLEKATVPNQPLPDDELTMLASQVKSTNLNKSDLRVEVCGSKTPPSSLFELKTRSTRNDIVLDPILLRLWLIQVPNLILARHTYGKFEDASPQDMTNDIQAWEKKNQRLLDSLHTLLHRLLESVKKYKDGKVEIRRIDQGPLEIRQLTESSWSALPRDLRGKWDGSSGLDSEDEEVEDYLKF